MMQLRRDVTEEYRPREGRRMKDEELFPNSTRQKEIVGRIQKILMDKGMLEGTAYETALKAWRVTRR